MSGKYGQKEYLMKHIKRIVFLAIFVCMVTAFAFAAENFTVQSVTGKVQREAGNQKIDVKVGDVINGDTVIITGVAASIVVKDSAGKTYTINAVQNGKVAELTKQAAGTRIGGNVSRSNTDAATRTAGQSATTASARASDQAGDDDIAAE